MEKPANHLYERQVFILKISKVFLPLFMIFTIIFGTVEPIVATSEKISDKVLRLHIIANSDSAFDQDVKLQLKDYFLENTKDIFIGNNLEENIKIANDNKEYINTICNHFLSQYNYEANVSVTKEYFDTRVYDDFTLPAGEYNSIKIEIGKGEGHNWWCIVFPSVCLSACSTSMAEYLTEEEMDLIQDGYTPKFKIIEIYEKLKNKIIT